jgi:hypothetical protein
MVGVPKALEHCHAHTVIHRDIKPENVLVSTFPVLVDFGLAHVLDDDEGAERFSRGLAGTGPYIPDETRRDFRVVSFGNDIYASGVTLYELIAGEVPRSEHYESIAKFAGKDADGSLDAIIRKAMAAREQRYESATAFREALSAWGDDARRRKTMSAAVGGVTDRFRKRAVACEAREQEANQTAAETSAHREALREAARQSLLTVGESAFDQAAEIWATATGGWRRERDVSGVRKNNPHCGLVRLVLQNRKFPAWFIVFEEQDLDQDDFNALRPRGPTGVPIFIQGLPESFLQPTYRIAAYSPDRSPNPTTVGFFVAGFHARADSALCPQRRLWLAGFTR